MKELNSYLEKKRLLSKANYYFLFLVAVLLILTQIVYPVSVGYTIYDIKDRGPYLMKCFEGIAKLQFKDNLDITKMLSCSGDYFI